MIIGAQSTLDSSRAVQIIGAETRIWTSILDWEHLEIPFGLKLSNEPYFAYYLQQHWDEEKIWNMKSVSCQRIMVMFHFLPKSFKSGELLKFWKNIKYKKLFSYGNSVTWQISGEKGV